MENPGLLDRVQLLCTTNHLTFAALERQLGFGNGTLRKWGFASPSGDRLIKVADYFHVSTDYLLGRESSPIGVAQLKDEYVRLARQAQERNISTEILAMTLDMIQQIQREMSR